MLRVGLIPMEGIIVVLVQAGGIHNGNVEVPLHDARQRSHGLLKKCIIAGLGDYGVAFRHLMAGSSWPRFTVGWGGWVFGEVRLAAVGEEGGVGLVVSMVESGKGLGAERAGLALAGSEEPEGPADSRGRTAGECSA